MYFTYKYKLFIIKYQGLGHKNKKPLTIRKGAFNQIFMDSMGMEQFHYVHLDHHSSHMGFQSHFPHRIASLTLRNSRK